MIDIFTEQNFLEFTERFKTNEDCNKYLATLKSESHYKCLKCAHSACQNRKDLARQCNICGHIESANANTLFHKVKFGVRKAFFLCFEMSTSTKSLSASYYQFKNRVLIVRFSKKDTITRSIKV